MRNAIALSCLSLAAVAFVISTGMAQEPVVEVYKTPT
jgi:hypothetical protein